MSVVKSLFVDLDDSSRYHEWRDRKLALMPDSIDEYLVSVQDPVRLTDEEHDAQPQAEEPEDAADADVEEAAGSHAALDAMDLEAMEELWQQVKMQMRAKAHEG